MNAASLRLLYRTRVDSIFNTHDAGVKHRNARATPGSSIPIVCSGRGMIASSKMQTG